MSLVRQQSHPDIRLPCASSVLKFCLPMVVSFQKANNTPLRIPSSSKIKALRKEKCKILHCRRMSDRKVYVLVHSKA